MAFSVISSLTNGYAPIAYPHIGVGFCLLFRSGHTIPYRGASSGRRAHGSCNYICIMGYVTGVYNSDKPSWITVTKYHVLCILATDSVASDTHIQSVVTVF